MSEAAGIKWITKSSGRATWYESEDGRFSISRSGSKRGTWHLFDRAMKDGVTPEFNRCETVYRLQDARKKAERWLAGKRW